ncbi:MAG TPA: glucuronate isomerase [Granulicella sp.]
MSLLHPDRLFPADPETRAIAQRLYKVVADLPIISPHGHTQAGWFAENKPFPDPASLFIIPDHYIYRMLYSQGDITLDDVGVGTGTPERPVKDPRGIWQLFAERYFLFRGTPTRLWLDYVFEEVFGLHDRLSAKTADLYYDTIAEKLSTPEFLPRALFERFNIEVLATTDAAIDPLTAHIALRESGWKGRVLPTFRPDACVDPEFAGFQQNLAKLGEIYKEDTTTWAGYLKALRSARAFFKQQGATATDHGHASPRTAALSTAEAEALFARVLEPEVSAADAELFRAQMLTEMARMSLEDGLVMQIHPGSIRNHNETIYRKFGRDVGADIPGPTEYVHALKPLLDQFGNEPSLTIILFTLDETTYSRELAPLAGHYPCLKLGPPWWFHDSPEGMMRFREQATETAGFYNTVGFNDDTRAFLSIPARHDVARRVDCAFLARLVAEHRLEEDEAVDVAIDLTNGLVRRAYKL